MAQTATEPPALDNDALVDTIDPRSLVEPRSADAILDELADELRTYDPARDLANQAAALDDALRAAAENIDSEVEVERIVASFISDRAEPFRAIIAQTVANHPDVRAALSRQSQADETVIETRSALRPLVSAGIRSTASQFNGADDDLDGQLRGDGFTVEADAFIRFRQVLFDGGAGRFDLRAARLEAEAARFDQLGAVGQITLEAIQAYFQVLGFQIVLDLSQVHVAQLEAVRDQVQERYELGGSTLSDLARADADLADARTRLSASRQRLAEAQADYLSVFGAPAGRLSLPPPPASLPNDIDRAVELALIDAPAQRAVRAQLRAAEQNRKAERARGGPSVLFEGNALKFDLFEDNDAFGVTGRVIASYNLFESGARRARTRRAQSVVDEALHQAEATARDIEREARVAYRNVQSLIAERASAQLAARANEEARVVTLEQFKLIGGDLLTVLNAEINAHLSATTWVETLVNLEISRYRLLAATAGVGAYFDLSALEAAVAQWESERD
ncbi:MAG: TolC family protein [Maricaulaceae bacterium]